MDMNLKTQIWEVIHHWCILWRKKMLKRKVYINPDGSGYEFRNNLKTEIFKYQKTWRKRSIARIYVDPKSFVVADAEIRSWHRKFENDPKLKDSAQDSGSVAKEKVPSIKSLWRENLNTFVKGTMTWYWLLRRHCEI